MSDKKSKRIKADNTPEYTLIKAEEEGEKFGRISYSLPLTLSYLGIFSSLVCEYMVIMSALSQPDHTISYVTMAGGAIVFVLCVVLAIVFFGLEKKSIEQAQSKREDFLKSVAPIDATIISVNKYNTLIHNSGNVYENALWSFNVAYRDTTTDEIKTVESEKYLNNVTEVLKNNTLKIYLKDDESFELDNFSFRENEADEKFNFTIDETIVGEETVYTFDSVSFGKKKENKKQKEKINK